MARRKTEEEMQISITPPEEMPKRRGRPKKNESKAPTTDADGVKLPKASKFGVWSDDRFEDASELPIIRSRMKIEIQLLRKSLGMSPSDPDALKYVAQKEDEIDIYGDGNQNERAITIWPKALFVPSDIEGVWTLVNEPGCPEVDREKAIYLPFIYDYQIRGMFKDDCGLLNRSKNNESADLKAYKKRIDGNIFIASRKIAFNIPETYKDDMGIERPSRDENGALMTLARPLRTSGPTGERSAIAISEVIPPMSTLKFEILMTDENLKPVIVEWLDYGLLHGIGQWRNSGIGIFRWRELDDNWQPIGG